MKLKDALLKNFVRLRLLVALPFVLAAAAILGMDNADIDAIKSYFRSMKNGEPW